MVFNPSETHTTSFMQYIYKPYLYPYLDTIPMSMVHHYSESILPILIPSYHTQILSLWSTFQVYVS